MASWQPTAAAKDKQRMRVKESGGGLADVSYPRGGKAIKVARLVPSGSLGRCTSAAGFYSVPYRGAFTINLCTHPQQNARTEGKKTTLKCTFIGAATMSVKC